MAYPTANEQSPRFRRKSSFRLWSKDEEDELLAIDDDMREQDVPEGLRPAEVARRWMDRGHAPLGPDELLKKTSSIRKIKAMLQRKGSATAGNIMSHSLQEDAKWEAETLDLVRHGDVEEFSRRLSVDRRASEVSDERDRTALHHAAATGNLTLVTMIGEGHNLDITDKDGRTPLFFALAAAHDEVADWLVHQGASVDVVDAQGVTPLHVAVHTNNRHCTRLLLETERVDANAADEKGTTPLHVAAHRASSDVVELLLAAGADPQAKDKRGNLPCTLAQRMDKGANSRRLSTMSHVGTVVQAALRFQKGASRPAPVPAV